MAAVENLKNAVNNIELIDVRCPVCFQLNLDPLMIIGCKHSMCSGCAGRWLTVCQHCPLCRKKVVELEINEELKEKANKYQERHPEHAVPHDLLYEHSAYETLFWSIQARKNVNDPDRVYYGEKKIRFHGLYSEEEIKSMTEAHRVFRIRERLELLKERIGIQTPLVQRHYNEQMFNRLFYQNEAIYGDEDQQWRMIHGRGLVRVPRSTNRNYCPLRFRRSHST